MTTVSTEFDSILEKYKKHKLQAYAVAELLSDDYTFKDFGVDTQGKRFEALVNCGTQLQFEKSFEGDKYIYHLRGANFCRQRCCPMCQFRRSEKMFAEVLRVVKLLENDYRFLHLVLTIPNSNDGNELIQAIRLLYKGFSFFMAYKSIRGAFKGVLRCLEISYNYESDSFHPHLHCLVAVNKSYFNDSKSYLSYDKLRFMWSEAIEKAQKKLPFEFQFLRDKPPLLQIHIGSIKEGDTSGVAEVCKYCVKPLEFEGADNDYRAYQNKKILLTLWHTLKGFRFVQKYGVIKEAFKTLNISDDDIEEETKDKNTPLIWFDWDFSTMNYKGGEM